MSIPYALYTLFEGTADFQLWSDGSVTCGSWMEPGSGIQFPDTTQLVSTSGIITSGQTGIFATLNNLNSFANVNTFNQFLVVSGIYNVNNSNSPYIDINNQVLYAAGSPAIPSVQWHSGFLYSGTTSPAVSLDWHKNILSGTWSVQSLLISGSTIVLASQTGGFGGGPGGGSGTNVQITGSSTLTTANFTGISGLNVRLSGDGSTVILDAGGLALANHTGHFAMTNANNTFASATNTFSNTVDLNGTINLGSSASIVLTDTSSIQSISQGAALLNPAGNQVLIWGAIQQLQDSSATASLDWTNRIAFDNASSISINYQNRELSGVLPWRAQNLIISGSPVVIASQTGNLISNGMTGSLVSAGLTGNFITNGMTGVLTNQFYPLNSNPAGYVTSSAGGTSVEVTGSQALVSGNIIGVSGIAVLLSGANTIMISSIGGSNNGFTGNFAMTNFGNTFNQLNTFNSNLSAHNIQNIANQLCVNLDANLLVNVNTTATSIDWADCLMYDNSTNTQSIDYSNRWLNDSAGIKSLDWNNRILSGTWSVNNFSGNSNSLGNETISGSVSVLYPSITGLPASGLAANSNNSIGLLLGNVTQATFGAGGVQMSPTLNFSGGFYATGYGFTGNVPMQWRMYATGTTGILGTNIINPLLNLDLSTGSGIFLSGITFSYPNKIATIATTNIVSNTAYVSGNPVVTVNPNGNFVMSGGASTNFPYRSNITGLGSNSTRQAVLFSSAFSSANYTVSLCFETNNSYLTSSHSGVLLSVSGKANTGFYIVASSGIPFATTIDYQAWLYN